jgi:hypothetical protein
MLMELKMLVGRGGSISTTGSCDVSIGSIGWKETPVKRSLPEFLTLARESYEKELVDMMTASGGNRFVTDCLEGDYHNDFDSAMSCKIFKALQLTRIPFLLELQSGLDDARTNSQSKYKDDPRIAEWTKPFVIRERI